MPGLLDIVAISFQSMEDLTLCYLNKMPLLSIFMRKDTHYIGHIMDIS